MADSLFSGQSSRLHVLMSRVSRKVHDVRLLKLIGCFLRAGVMVEGVIQPTDEGSPQGGPLSPLLSNILLDDLDKELEHRRLKFVRYADYFVIFVRTERSAQRVFSSVQRYLTRVLKLVVNEEKSSVRLSRDCEYLGFAFTGKRVTITVAPKKPFHSEELSPFVLAGLRVAYGNLCRGRKCLQAAV
ncbi:MAG: reverse transcriptase domain-containing protein [Fuerstiella sp.]